jgi:DNA-binding response OmpR family regulator
LEPVIRGLKINIIILEVLNHDDLEVEIIQRIKLKYPQVMIVLVDGDSDFTAQLIDSGITDVFSKPLNTSLLIERVIGLLKHPYKNNLM